jgi:TRAP-type uncharacterized transport system fused permease subunit
MSDDIMNKLVVERTTIFFVSIVVFLVLYKVAKMPVEVAGIWAAVVLLALRLMLWRGVTQWMKPIYRITGVAVVEKFENKARLMDGIDILLKSSHMPISKRQKQEIAKMKEQFRNIA